MSLVVPKHRTPLPYVFGSCMIKNGRGFGMMSVSQTHASSLGLRKACQFMMFLSLCFDGAPRLNVANSGSDTERSCLSQHSGLIIARRMGF